MRYSNHLSELASYIKVFPFNLNQSITKDISNTFIYTAIIILVVFGVPPGDNGLNALLFKLIHPEYKEMDLAIYHYERWLFSNILTSVLYAFSIFSTLFIWLITTYQVSFEKSARKNAAHLFLYCYRFIFSLQIIALITIPLLLIDIFNLVILKNSESTFNSKLLMSLTGKQLLFVYTLCVLFFLHFLIQVKKVIVASGFEERGWLITLKNKVSLGGCIPLFIGISFGYFVYQQTKIENLYFGKITSFNMCIFVKENPNIPANNLIKVAYQDLGCKAFSECNRYSDPLLQQGCERELYAKSEAFLKMVKNNPDATCSINLGPDQHT